MGLELRKGKDGKVVRHWYGVYKDEKGKRIVLALKTAIPADAIIPASLRQQGDEKFEQSREKAHKELDDHKEEARRKGRATHLTERLIQAKTGRKPEYVKLSDLAAKWRSVGRETSPTPAWLAWCDTVCNRFAAATSCTYLHEITTEQANAYTETLRKDYTRRTARGAASLLRSAFARFLPLGTSNPFEGGIARKGEYAAGSTIHRRPLTVDELSNLFETARADPLVYPLTVCAACTGLRIGDVCLLKWSAIDLHDGIIAIRTSKTGKGVEIPIFKPLQHVFETALAEKRDSEYVWPNAAEMYQKNRYGIVYRGKALFAKAFPKSAPKSLPKPEAALDKEQLAETLPSLVSMIKAAAFLPSKESRLLDTLRRYTEGQSYRKIESETGRLRSQISEDLKEIEQLATIKLRPGKTVPMKTDLKSLISDTRQSRGKGNGKLSASLLGWHSLRGTWATLALSAGIPVETVKLVTGHGTANTVLKFYYNPQREHLRSVLGEKLPEVLTGSKATQGNTSATRPKKREEHAEDRVSALASQFKQLSETERKQLATLLSENRS